MVNVSIRNIVIYRFGTFHGIGSLQRLDIMKLINAASDLCSIWQEREG
jgi:hypothetical protein